MIMAQGKGGAFAVIFLLRKSDICLMASDVFPTGT